MHKEIWMKTSDTSKQMITNNLQRCTSTQAVIRWQLCLPDVVYLFSYMGPGKNMKQHVWFLGGWWKETIAFNVIVAEILALTLLLLKFKPSVLSPWHMPPLY